MTIQKYLKTIQRQIDARLGQMVQKTTPRHLYLPIRYALSMKGKRLRPALLILACRSLGGRTAACLHTAVAIELLHSFTLVHDDIMDQDMVRRGQPTLHTKWDESVALLAGDGVIALAYLELFETRHPALSRICDIFSQGILTVCEGQALDKEFETAQGVTLRAYAKMIDRKTATLMAISAEMGGILANGSKRTVAVLRHYGHDLGMAFQVQDDLLDLIADEATLGKDIGSDLAQGKKTYPLLMLRERVSRQDGVRLRRLMSAKSGSRRALREVIALLETYGVIADTHRTVDRWIKKAVGRLDGPGAPPEVGLLRELAMLIQQRQS